MAAVAALGLGNLCVTRNTSSYSGIFDHRRRREKIDRHAKVMKLDAAVLILQTGAAAIKQFSLFITQGQLFGVPCAVALRDGAHQAGLPVPCFRSCGSFELRCNLSLWVRRQLLAIRDPCTAGAQPSWIGYRGCKPCRLLQDCPGSLKQSLAITIPHGQLGRRKGKYLVEIGETQVGVALECIGENPVAVFTGLVDTDNG